MEKEQIIKALECCTRGRKSNEDIPCLECPYNECNIVGGTSERQTKGSCQWWLMKDATALIKELTEELEKERTWANSMIDNLRDDIRELTEENRRVKADTVREIKTRFALRYGTYTDKYMTPITEVFWLLDRIANEILNNTEDEEK
jgi:hypothetical protein